MAIPVMLWIKMAGGWTPSVAFLSTNKSIITNIHIANCLNTYLSELLIKLEIEIHY
jgi:hypothetical protein